MSATSQSCRTWYLITNYFVLSPRHPWITEKTLYGFNLSVTIAIITLWQSMQQYYPLQHYYYPTQIFFLRNKILGKSFILIRSCFAVVAFFKKMVLLIKLLTGIFQYHNCKSYRLTMTLNLLDFDAQNNQGEVHRLIPYSISLSDFCLLFGAMIQNYM